MEPTVIREICGISDLQHIVLYTEWPEEMMQATDLLKHIGEIPRQIATRGEQGPTLTTSHKHKTQTLLGEPIGKNQVDVV